MPNGETRGVIIGVLITAGLIGMIYAGWNLWYIDEEAQTFILLWIGSTVLMILASLLVRRTPTI